MEKTAPDPITTGILIQSAVKMKDSGARTAGVNTETTLADSTGRSSGAWVAARAPRAGQPGDRGGVPLPQASPGRWLFTENHTPTHTHTMKVNKSSPRAATPLSSDRPPRAGLQISPGPPTRLPAAPPFWSPDWWLQPTAQQPTHNTLSPFHARGLHHNAQGQDTT